MTVSLSSQNSPSVIFIWTPSAGTALATSWGAFCKSCKNPPKILIRASKCRFIVNPHDLQLNRLDLQCVILPHLGQRHEVFRGSIKEKVRKINIPFSEENSSYFAVIGCGFGFQSNLRILSGCLPSQPWFTFRRKRGIPLLFRGAEALNTVIFLDFIRIIQLEKAFFIWIGIQPWHFESTF